MKSAGHEAASFEYVRVLSIAGSDSGGGAGIQADLKTFAALGCYGLAVITAVTAQGAGKAGAVHGVPGAIVSRQIEAAVQDAHIDAVKIGMLHSAAVVQEVSDSITRHALQHIVLDPVMASSSGVALLEEAAIALLVDSLFAKVTLVTPNLDEAEALTGLHVRDERAMEIAAHALLGKGARAVLIKGGHLQGDVTSDLLLLSGQNPVWMRAPRIATANTRGTGCTLSSAIAAHLALGLGLPEAVSAARDFVRAALLSGAPVRAGSRTGPLNHTHAPRPMVLRRREQPE